MLSCGILTKNLNKMVKDKYRDETNKDVYSERRGRGLEESGTGTFSDDYVRWLEKQLSIANVSNAKQNCFGKDDLRYVYEDVDTKYKSFEDWFKEYTLPI